MTKMIWIVCEDSHGTISYWEKRKDAEREVERVYSELYGDGTCYITTRSEDSFIDDSTYYGCDFVYTTCVELNEPW